MYLSSSPPTTQICEETSLLHSHKFSWILRMDKPGKGERRWGCPVPTYNSSPSEDSTRQPTIASDG